MMDLGLRRQFFAEEVAAIANLRTPELIDALRSVPREEVSQAGSLARARRKRLRWSTSHARC